jgi:saccharopine dehydrogenase-like NADP-dependent oxidoreductase
MSNNILVLGAGELGLPVLRNLARRAKQVDGAKISVLRASAANPVRRASDVISR